MATPRLTPLLKDTEVLGQETIDNTSLPTQQDPIKPLRLRPSGSTSPSIPVLGAREIEDPFNENYAELDRDISADRNLEAQLAAEQGGGEIFMNAIGQFANEFVLGTV
jgi:hypothetical protein